MSDHARKYIRDAVKAMLDGNTNAGARVSTNRVRVFFGKELPAINIFTMDEGSKVLVKYPRAYTRTVQLIVSISTAVDEAMDDVLDALCKQVEDILGADPKFNKTATDSELAGTSYGIDADGGRQFGVAQMIYETTYESYATEELPEHDFEGVDTTFENKPAEEQPLRGKVDF